VLLKAVHAIMYAFKPGVKRVLQTSSCRASIEGTGEMYITTTGGVYITNLGIQEFDIFEQQP
jgi:hypothetical protein